jgi:hypothetical protein
MSAFNVHLLFRLSIYQRVLAVQNVPSSCGIKMVQQLKSPVFRLGFYQTRSGRERTDYEHAILRPGGHYWLAMWCGTEVWLGVRR